MGCSTSEGGHFKTVHLGEGDDEGKLFIVNAQLEESPASDDLEGGQDDATDIHVRDEDVARHLSDVLQEAQVQMLILEPSQLQVAIHVGAIDVAFTEVPVVVLPVGWNGHPPIGSNAN